MVCATLRTSWRTDSSAPLPLGTPALRKYLLTATSVASCDQSAGTSASSILKTTSPSAPEILAGRRVHSTASRTSCAVAPSRVTRRSIDSPLARRELRGDGCWPFPCVAGPAAGAACNPVCSFPLFAIRTPPRRPVVGWWDAPAGSASFRAQDDATAPPYKSNGSYQVLYACVASCAIDSGRPTGCGGADRTYKGPAQGRF